MSFCLGYELGDNITQECEVANVEGRLFYSQLMKRKLLSRLMLVLVVILAYGLGYWSGFSRAQNAPRVIVGRDTADSRISSAGKEGYEPVFTKRNQIPDKVK